MGPWTAQAGALSVTAERKAGAEPGHRNLVIENNRFVENDGVNLLLQAVDGVVVKGNTFERPGQTATRRGSGRGVDPGALIWISDCRNVRFEGNKVTNAGAAMQTLVGVGPGTTNLAGKDSGVSR
jgi:polygalacturonase